MKRLFSGETTKELFAVLEEKVMPLSCYKQQEKQSIGWTGIK